MDGNIKTFINIVIKICNMKNLIWRIILIVSIILFFGYLDYKYRNIPKIDDDTIEIVMDQQIIDTYYTE